jgi:hypothetical protein
MLAAALALGGVTAPASAHRGHASLSVVEIDAKSGAVRVTHRFAAHDVEPVLVDIAPDAQPSLDDPEAVAALVAYVGQRFTIAGAPLTFQSQQLRGDDVMLVYTGRMKPSATSISVRGALFGETHASHQTQVNVRRAGVTRTLYFEPSDGAKTLALSGRK